MSRTPIRDGYEDLKPTGEFPAGGANSPTLKTFRGDYDLFAFDGTGTNDRATFKFHLPHDYVEDSDIYIHVHWALNKVSPTGNVKWKATMSYAKGYENGAFSTDYVVSLPDATVNSTQYSHHITESSAITSANLGSTLMIDGVIIVSLERDTTDTNGDDVFFIECDLHYLSDGRKTVNKNDTGSGFEKV
jgi:hypothetical protein